MRLRARATPAVLAAGVLGLAVAGCGSSAVVHTVTVTAPDVTAPTTTTTTTTAASTPTAPPATTVTVTAPASNTGGGTVSTEATSPPTNASPTADVLFEGVTQPGHSEPSALDLTVDGTLYVTVSNWSSWGGTTATGTGTAEYHGCAPSCGQAKPQYTAVSILLSGLTQCSGTAYYDRVQLTESDGTVLDASYLAGQHWAPCLQAS